MLNRPLSTCQYPFKNSFQTALRIKIFKGSAIYYEDTLNKAGYISKLVSHISSANNQENKNKRNVIWFNPPYNKNVTMRIGQSFLHLIETYFTKKHTFNTILDRNKVQLSYSCTQNIKKIMIVTYIVYQGKIMSSQPNYTEDVYFDVAENHSKIL